MSRSSFPSSSTFAVVVGGVVFSLGLAGCDAGAGLRAGGSSLSAALESCEELMTEADAAAAAAETACAADSACTPESLQAQQAQIYADAQASCDALVTSDDDDGDGDGDAQGEHGNADHKITICHSTGSAHHPFVTITIDEHAIPAHDRHHDGRDIIPAPADGCPAADDDDGSDDGDHGHGHGGGGNGADGDDDDDDGEEGNGPDEGPNDGGDGPNDGGDSGEGGNDAPDCTALRAEADATIADAAAERDTLCAFDAENACPAATADFEATQTEIEADYAAVCGAAPLIAE